MIAVRRRAGLICGALLLAGLAAGAASAETLTDSAKRTVDIAAPVARAVPAGAPAQVLLHALAPGKLVGLVEPFAPDHAVYVDERVADLPQIPVLTRTDAPADVAAVAALHPGLAVDYGSVNARYTAADGKIGDELKIPAVLFGSGLGDAGPTLRALGRVLGDDRRAEALAATVADVLGRVKPVADLPEAERVAVYLGRGADGLEGARAGTSFDEAIRLAGGRNVVTGTGGTFRRLTVDEVRALHPAVVVVADRGAMDGPLRSALPKETTFVLDSGEPYKVLAGPPSLNRLAGVLALAAVLHPGAVKVDADEPARVEATLFTVPPGIALPKPLQVSR